MKLKQRINDMSIKKKMIVYTYIVVAPILCLISLIVFFQDYNRMENELNELGSNGVDNLSTNVEELNQVIIELSTYICINYDISEILTSKEPEILNENSQLWQEKAPMRFIQDTLALKGYIKTLGIYPENGVNPYQRSLDATAYLPSIEDVRDTEMYETAVKAKGKVNWERINKYSSDVYKSNRTEKIVLYREIYDLSKQTKLGYLVIGADAGKYKTTCETSLIHEGDAVVVLNPEGELLVSGGSSNEEMEGFFSGEEFFENYIVAGVDKFSYNNWNVFVKQNEDSGLISCMLISKDSINDQLLSVAYAPILLLLGVLLGMFPVLILVSNVITRPLGRVKDAMIQFRQGDFNQQVSVDTKDEIGEVAAGFNQMVTDIKSLIDENYVITLREKESELTALQAQINPHFLYNTLDSLYWQALGAGNDDIADNILALANLFRMVLGEGKGIIEVGLERDLIKEYLKVQKMRFNTRLEYSIDIDKDIERETIPKLILQPFVENAIVHGFENVDDPCSIVVKGCRIEKGIEFVISDTGIGMNEEQIKAIFEVDDADRYRGQRIGRYAVKNVKERLSLQYHDNFELLVNSEPGEGTEIIIRLYNKE